MNIDDLNKRIEKLEQHAAESLVALQTDSQRISDLYERQAEDKRFSVAGSHHIDRILSRLEKIEFSQKENSAVNVVHAKLLESLIENKLQQTPMPDLSQECREKFHSGIQYCIDCSPFYPLSTSEGNLKYRCYECNESFSSNPGDHICKLKKTKTYWVNVYKSKCNTSGFAVSEYCFLSLEDALRDRTEDYLKTISFEIDENE